MDPITIGMIGMTAMKAINDKKREARQRQLQAETTRYSPWTGMVGEAPQEADTMGTLMQGGAGALAQHQAGVAAEGAKQLQDAQIKRYGAETDYINSQMPQKTASIPAGTPDVMPGAAPELRKKPMLGAKDSSQWGKMARQMNSGYSLEEV